MWARSALRGIAALRSKVSSASLLARGSAAAIVLIAAQPAAVLTARAQASNETHYRTYGGNDLGVPNLKDISEAESAVRFTDSGDVKRRQAATLSDRTLEQLTLSNGALLTYNRIFLRLQDFGPRVVGKALAELPYQTNNRFLISRGIRYDEHDAKQAGWLAYLVQSSATDTCFIFNAYLGDSVHFDQQVHGRVCKSAASQSASQLEREMLTLLSHARFAQSVGDRSFRVSFEIPEAALIAPVTNGSGPLAPAQSQPVPATATPAPASTQSGATRSPSPTTAERLQIMKNLLDQKLITPSEYEAKRKAILDGL